MPKAPPKVVPRPAKPTPPAVASTTPTTLAGPGYPDAVQVDDATARPEPIYEPDNDDYDLEAMMHDAPPANVRSLAEVRAMVDASQWLVGAPTDPKTGRIAKTSLGLAWVLERHPDIGGTLRWNQRTQQPTIKQRLPWMRNGNHPREVDDWNTWDAELELWCQQQLGVSYSPQVIRRIVVALAQRDSYDPVVEYLDGLDEWDRTPRLDTFLVRHAGAPHTLATEAMTAAWMISAVQRAMQPGCKADHMLILEGPQGCRKSSLLRALAEPAGPDLFAEDMPVDLNTKDAQQYVGGPWLVEVAELASMVKTNIEKTKGFVTVLKDRYRPPYGAHMVTVPRRCVFAGSTNERDGYIGDSTGARRFWPIRCHRTEQQPIDVDAVRLEVPQLWAEALHRARAGEPHWLRGHVVDHAHALQTERQERSVWHDTLEQRTRGETWLTNDELWRAVGLETGQRTRAHGRTIRDTMTALGWREHRRADSRGWVPERSHRTEGDNDE